MLDYRDYINTDGYVLFLDFYKAFDCIEHPFLLEALHFLGFGETFHNVIKMFYTDISSCVSLNPGLTPRFKYYEASIKDAHLPKAFYIGNPTTNNSH